MVLSVPIGLCTISIFWGSNRKIYIKNGSDSIILARSFCNTIFLLVLLLLLLLFLFCFVGCFLYILQQQQPHQLFVQHVYHIRLQLLQQLQVTPQVQQQRYKYNSNKLLKTARTSSTNTSRTPSTTPGYPTLFVLFFFTHLTQKPAPLTAGTRISTAFFTAAVLCPKNHKGEAHTYLFLLFVYCCFLHIFCNTIFIIVCILAYFLLLDYLLYVCIFL